MVLYIYHRKWSITWHNDRFTLKGFRRSHHLWCSANKYKIHCDGDISKAHSHGKSADSIDFPSILILVINSSPLNFSLPRSSYQQATCHLPDPKFQKWALWWEHGLRTFPTSGTCLVISRWTQDWATWHSQKYYWLSSHFIPLLES